MTTEEALAKANAILSHGENTTYPSRPAATHVRSVIGQLIDAARAWELVEKLRAPEGHSVTVFCDNPDFVGPAAVVECCGDWTEWRTKRFSGETVLEALGVAYAASIRDKVDYGQR